MSLDPKKLTDALQRGRLTPDQEAQLETHFAANPADRAAWEEELRLNELLDHVPAAQLSSNFTARVLSAAQAELSAEGRRTNGWRQWLGLSWLPRLAGVTAVLCVGLFAYHEHELTVRREMARNVADVLASGATLEALENFEAVQRLSQVPSVDRELVAALQ